MIAIITFFGQRAKVACDEKCEKAWGISSRPRIQLSDDEDDFAFLSDDELGVAPKDPGTYEADDAKPVECWEKLNKWCVRECERCVISLPGKWMLPLKLPDFSQRKYNKNDNP